MNEKGGLRLVVDNTKSSADKLRTGRLQNTLCNTIWAGYSQEQAMENRAFFLQEDFEIKGVNRIVSETSESFETVLGNIGNPIISVDKKAELLKEKIIETLKDSGAILRTSDLKKIVPEIKTKILSAKIADGLLRGELGELTLEGEQLAMNNLKKSYIDLGDKIRYLAHGVLCREELENELRKKGFEIRNEALTKLMLLEMNEGCFYPKVLILPFDYKPYNPFVTLIDYDEPVYPELKALRLFAFLDEY